MDSVWDYKKVRVEDLIEFPHFKDGERYEDYLLCSMLKKLGYYKPTIFIRDDHRAYRHSDIKYKFLVADVYLRITEEQSKQFNTDKDFLYCAIPARYSGSNEDWFLAFYTYVDDIAIRFSQNPDGTRYSVTFTHYILDGKDHKLGGYRRDWDILEHKELRYCIRHN